MLRIFSGFAGVIWYSPGLTDELDRGRVFQGG